VGGNSAWLLVKVLMAVQQEGLPLVLGMRVVHMAIPPHLMPLLLLKLMCLLLVQVL